MPSFGDWELIVRNFDKRGILSLVAVAGLSFTALGQTAVPSRSAQPQTAEERKQIADHYQLIKDFIHYTRINQTEVAAGMGRKILQLNLPPTTFVDRVEGSGEEARFSETIFRAMKISDLEPVAAQLLKLYDKGKLERVRDPKEIEHNIALLKGMLNQKIFARERLVAAGEYALPQLLVALLNRSDPILQSEAQGILQNLGQQAIIPLCTALTQLDPVGQEQVADILGLIAYKTSLPYLFDVLSNTKSDPVRVACERAIGRIGAAGLTKDAGELYRDLGEGYYSQRPELTSFPGEQYQLLWNFNPSIGLNPTAIRTEVYHEAMAMRLGERSLGINPVNNDQSISLWLASNFRREIQTPAEYDNPTWPKAKRDAMFYAVNAGAIHNQNVLGRALDAKDTQLARKAIAAIEQTAGGSGLWSTKTDRKPLIEALRYPNRRVQYEAALSLGRAQPQQTFAGAERVVPILASAIRDAGTRYAVVIAGDKEVGANLRKNLEKSGYTVLPVALQLSEVAEPISEAPGIDLVVSSLTGERTNNLISEARSTPKLAATPIFSVVTSGQDAIDLSRKFERDPLVSIRQPGINEAQITEGITQLVDAASGGPIKPEEARDYSGRCLAVLRDLAISSSPVFNVGDASLPLIAAFPESAGKTKLDIAEVLARIDQKRTQVAVMDGALNATGDDRVALLGKAADSAKRFGNQLEPRQVERAMEVAAKGPDKEATAAAALVGSLNLSNSNLVPMILSK